MNGSPETGRAAHLCTRTTLQGNPCAGYRVHWYPRHLPDPKACTGHLTRTERQAFEDDKLRRGEAALPLQLARGLFLNGHPACWSWPPLGYELDEEWGTTPLWGWQAGRCAICGRKTVLVTDHDHRTGLIRGGLCSRCNTAEGLSNAPVFVRYRDRNPASVLGIRQRYWDPIEKAYAQPAPPPGDPWKNNPMKGIGL
ncbi:recombination endonuclease VII [Thermomonospora umbrina]|uniref:Recombination endonuclease VII n=1 Tax=Thermomonospora umbrina TaxID=111806 RepID=A0A3D9SWI5_9ACTN|nr:recombination endonuclease VII [Thermomonospora umbrina]